MRNPRVADQPAAPHSPEEDQAAVEERKNQRLIGIRQKESLAGSSLPLCTRLRFAAAEPTNKQLQWE